jgi:hypothetical protein
MHRKLKRPALWIGLALTPILGLTVGGEAVHLLSTQASLQPAPGSGPPSGLLTAGTPVAVVERRGEWLKVRVEGWIPVSALPALHAEAAEVPPMPEEAAEPRDESSAAAAAGALAATAAGTAAASEAPASSTPAVAAADSPGEAASATGEAAEPATGAEAGASAGMAAGSAASAGSVAIAPGAVLRVEGVISGGSRRMRKISGAGSEVMLVSGDGLGAGDPEADAEARQRLSELEAEAAEIKKQADRAMKGDSFSSDSFTDSSREYEKKMAEWRRIMAERTNVLAALHGRHQADARKLSRASTVADERGFYTFGDLPPGTYTVYSRLVQKDLDVEWIETVTLASEPVRLDLGPENGRGFLEKK